MSPTRAASLAGLRDSAGCQVVLVTPDILGDYLPAADLHPAYPYLNLAHRSDYLRCCFMQRFGGGYADIKPVIADWRPHFARMEQRPEIWITGYPEVGPGGIANLYSSARTLGQPGPVVAMAWLRRKWLQAHHRRLVGCGAYICRPGTPLLNAWRDEVNRRLDRLLPLLQAHPARHPRDVPGMILEDGSLSQYPVPWSYLNGDLFQPLGLKHARHLSRDLPPPDFTDYL